MGRTKTKELDLVWNVFICDMNSKQVEIHNIFDHYSFRESIKKLMKEKLTKEEFDERLRREISYYYWTKVEWEITVSYYPSHIDKDEMERLVAEREQFYRENGRYPYSYDAECRGAKRVDVADQVRLNWDAFGNYVWEHKPNKI